MNLIHLLDTFVDFNNKISDERTNELTETKPQGDLIGSFKIHFRLIFSSVIFGLYNHHYVNEKSKVSFIKLF